jgi:hypothetical protein
LSEFRDAPGGMDQANADIHFEAMIERGWRCNWSPTLSECTDALGGHDRASLETQLEAEIN